jgi:hypothetical protein
VRPHKRASASVEITTSIPPERLAAMCKKALAEESEKWLRVDREAPEELIFGLRGPYREDSRQLQWTVNFQAGANGATGLRTKITAYEQERTLFFPATMRGLPRYEKWMRRLAEHVQAADPIAGVNFVG